MRVCLWPDIYFMCVLPACASCAYLLIFHACVLLTRYIFQMTLFISTRVARVEILIIPACVLVDRYVFRVCAACAYLLIMHACVFVARYTLYVCASCAH